MAYILDGVCEQTIAYPYSEQERCNVGYAVQKDGAPGTGDEYCYRQRLARVKKNF